MPIPERLRPEFSDVCPSSFGPFTASCEPPQEARPMDAAARPINRMNFEELEPTLGLSQDAPCDDKPLDLAGALVDLGDARVAVVALDAELGGVAVAAVDLEGFVRDARTHLGGQELGHRALGGVLDAFVLHGGGAE